eukprot:15360245-Ditylum_brightwellii.AAC.1
MTRWKTPKVLQTISTVVMKDTTTVQQLRGWEVQSVECPYDLYNYQDYIGAVDKSNQYRTLGAAFFNFAYFKNWYKKGYFGVTDFSMLKSFSGWNLPADELTALQHCGVVQKKRLIKWE